MITDSANRISFLLELRENPTLLHKKNMCCMTTQNVMSIKNEVACVAENTHSNLNMSLKTKFRYDNMINSNFPLVPFLLSMAKPNSMKCFMITNGKSRMEQYVQVMKSSRLGNNNLIIFQNDHLHASANI